MSSSTIKIKKSIFTVLFIFLSMLKPVFANSIGKFTDIKGDVFLERLKIFIKPKINDAVQVKDLVMTGYYGRTKLILIDSSLLTIGNNSKVEITDFLLDMNLRKGIILIKAGALHTKAEKFLEMNSRFEVRTPTAVIGARGTEWFTEINKKGETIVFSIADTIRVYNPAYPNQSVDVREGYFTVIERGKLPKKPESYCPSDLYIIMKKWDAEEGLNIKKLNASEELCNSVR